MNEVPKDDQPSSLDFAGSTVVAVAESKEEVLKILENDVYAKEGVWDLSKVNLPRKLPSPFPKPRYIAYLCTFLVVVVPSK